METPEAVSTVPSGAPTPAPAAPLRASSLSLRCQCAAGNERRLEPLHGPGATVLCGPQPEALATARRLYPDRRLEVKRLYAEPDLGPSRGPEAWRLLRWMAHPAPAAEPAEEVRRRVVETGVRLVQLAREHEEGTLVAGPLFLRLLAFKLNAIGYGGGFLRGFRPGEGRSYRYRP